MAAVVRNSKRQPVKAGVARTWNFLKRLLHKELMRFRQLV